VVNTDINFNLYVVLPSVDAIQEFKVQSGIYSTEFGREAGQVNVSTKSGTNTYHGAVFEFLRNDKLDASNQYAPAEVAVPPEPVRLHAGRPGADSEDVQRPERPVPHVGLRGLQEPDHHGSLGYNHDAGHAQRRFSLAPTQLQDPSRAPARAQTPPPLHNPAIRSRLTNNNYQYLSKSPVDKHQVTEPFDFQ
jgi:hypothetical protein